MGLGKRINEIRKEKGITLDELCEKSGIPKGTLSKITAEITNNPTLETVRLISSALGCSLDDLDETTQKIKKAPSYSEEAQELAKDYDGLDDHGKRVVRLVADEEKARCDKEPDTPASSVKESGAV